MLPFSNYYMEYAIITFYPLFRQIFLFFAIVLQIEIDINIIKFIFGNPNIS